MITSSTNPLIKKIKRLDQRKYRRQEGAFVVEGIHNFLAAVETRAAIQTALYSPELLTSHKCYQALRLLERQNVTVAEVSAEIFRSFSERENPAGILAILTIPQGTLQQLVPQPNATFVALVDPADPGNVGTILRTLDATGGAGLILVGQSTDLYHPTTVKASMGAVFTIPTVEVASTEVVWDWAKKHKLPIVATSAHAQLSYWEQVYPAATLFLMGSERHGLSAEMLAHADWSVRIPMMGSVSSLNLAMATGLLLYEKCRQSTNPAPN